MDSATAFLEQGWATFPHDAGLADWAIHARAAARTAIDDPAYAHWHMCQGTWFVGVDALPNGPDGAVAGSAPLAGPALDLAARVAGPVPPLHRAQVSVVWPGYPQPREGESDGAFRYRRTRDAAHVDGVRAAGPDRRRRIDECHAFILGLPLNDVPPDAAPLVVWEGSHDIMRAALLRALEGHHPADWGTVDVTDAYQAARRQVFDTCPRRPLPGRPGEAVLLHRLTLHGVAPWTGPHRPEGRMIAYFRPELSGDTAAWLTRA